MLSLERSTVWAFHDLSLAEERLGLPSLEIWAIRWRNGPCYSQWPYAAGILWFPFQVVGSISGNKGERDEVDQLKYIKQLCTETFCLLCSNLNQSSIQTKKL
ncbi:hypothetical protein Droror1_Dr00016187 [Drosera rotundifolia]